MRIIFAAAALGAALAVSACDDTAGKKVSASDALTSEGLVTLASVDSTISPNGSHVAEALRLARQASFGPNQAVLEQIARAGVEGWIDQQLVATGSTYADLAKGVRTDICRAGDSNCNRRYFSRIPVAMRFYADALTAPDQLRQRVAFALSQMIVASEQEIRSTAGIAAFNQIFLTNAFGNYRDILKAVTLNGYMGDYLDMAGSSKAAPSENYARELLQLFSMGPNLLNMNGTVRRDATGAPVANYSPDDIRGVARALTGWTQARIGNATRYDTRARDYAKPMVPDPDRYDNGEKRFLGTTVAAGTPQQASVDAVVNAAFNHPSTAPFVARHLIVHLVTANPSPAYVNRIANIFARNSNGVRGDLKAVVRAILLDEEARNPKYNAGKLKEPVLVMTSLARAIGFTSDGYAFVNRDTSFGQPVMNAPSVFNFYPIDYPLPGSSTLRSPVSKLLNTSTVMRLHNFVYDWTIAGEPNRTEFARPAGLPNASGTKPVWATWEALGGNVDAMIAAVDALMLGNSLSKSQRGLMKAAAMGIVDIDTRRQARKRAQLLIFLAGTSPMFLVDR